MFLFLAAIILIAYGYYGYYYVPAKSMGPIGPPCPFGHESTTSGFLGLVSYGSGPCKYSKISLIIGLVLVALAVVMTLFKKK
jgi:hypothetical protein